MKQKKTIRSLWTSTAKWLCSATRRAEMLLTTLLLTMTVQTARAEDVTVTSEATSWTNGNTYNVTSNVTISDRIKVTGDVTLNLGSGATLTASKGIELSNGNKLTINGSGTLDAKGDEVTINGVEYRAAAIGSYSFGELIINGGTINADGWEGSAGIGGSYDSKNQRGNQKGGSITINGGTINATGGNSSAGIGGSSALKADNSFSGGGFGITLTINGGKVKARRHHGTYAIGPGYYGEKTDYTITVGWTNADDFIDHDGLHTSPSFATGKKFARSGATTNITGYEFRTSGKYVPGATVTFDANGGSSVSKQSVALGSTASEPTAPTRTGYAFTGWTKGGVAYDFSTAVNEDITLVAQWEKQAVVTFNSNGGTDVATQYVTKGLTASEPTAPTRDGYNFRGWTLGGVDYDFSTAVNDDITLVAQWSAITTLTLGSTTDNDADIATAGATGDLYNVTLSGRTIYADGDWNTLTLPFSLTASQIAASPLADLTFKELNCLTSGLDGDGKLTLNFTDATTIEAGKPYIARWKSDAEYDLLISNKSDWDAFADAVNGGEAFEGKTVMLASDFDNSSDPVTKMVGTYKNSQYYPFKGTFDGNGRTLTVNINKTSNYTAPFYCIIGATIKNLRVAGNITSEGRYMAGLVGRVNDGTVNIQNCEVSATLTTKYNTANPTMNGGIVSLVHGGTVTVSNSLFSGKMLKDASINVEHQFNAGIVGYAYEGSTTVSYCLFAPTEITMSATNSQAIAVKKTDKALTITSCYYNSVGSAFGNSYGGAAASTNVNMLVSNLGSSNWEVVNNNAVPKMTTTTTSHANIVNPTFSNVIIVATAPTAATSDDGKVSLTGTYSPFTSTDGLLFDVHNTANGAFHAALSALRDGDVVNAWYTDEGKTTPATSIPFDADGNATLYTELIYNLDETDGITDAIATKIAGKQVSFTRSFSNGVASTICLPFPMTGLPENVVYEMASMNKDGGTWVATMTNVTSTDAGKPYLVKTQADGAVQFSGTVPNPFNGTAGTSSATYSGDGSWTFRGTYKKQTYGTDLDGAVYGFAAQSYAANSINPGDFVKAEAGAYILPFRCYLTYNEPSSARQMTRGADIELPSRIIVRLVNKNGSPTAIGTMDTKTGEVVFGDEWYTLDGRRIEGQPSTKGVYINNGKKVIVK